MEKFIHEENLALFKKRLAEPHTDAEREVLLKLLADEKAKEPLPKKSILKRADLHRRTAAQEALNTPGHAPMGPAYTASRTISAVK